MTRLGILQRCLMMCLLLPLGTLADPIGITNGTFEAGSLSPWVLTDSGAVVTTNFFSTPISPPGGNYMGYITTGLNELPSDLQFTDLDGDGVAEREYSSLSIEFFTPARAQVSVDLNFLTAEIAADGTVGDSDLFGVTTSTVTDTNAYRLLFAVAPPDGGYIGTANPLTAHDFSNEYIQDNIPSGSYPTIFDTSEFNGQTGFRHYSFAVGAGTHLLTFFVADSHTDGTATAMLIDNLAATTVPEPSSLVLVVVGLLALSALSQCHRSDQISGLPRRRGSRV